MAWSLLDSGTAGFADGNTGHVFTFPGGAASAGDLLTVSVSSNTTVSTPAGWQVAISDVGNLGAYIFYKVAAGGETSVTITTTGNFNTAIGYLRYATPTATPLDATVAARSTVSGSTTPAGTTPTLTQTGELSLSAACLGGLQGGTQTGISWSAGYTNRIDVTSGGTTATDQHLFTADNRNAGTAAQSPNATWTGPTNNQTLLVATFTAAPTGAIPPPLTQPGAHPRWLPKLRRAKQVEPPWAQGNQGQPWPSIIKPAGWSRPKWLPKLRRGKLFEPPWPQGPLGRLWPSQTTQPGAHPRWLPKLRRGKQFEPPWPQGTQGQNFPTWTTQPGARPRWFPLPRRGRLFEPPWPQGNQGQPWPSETTQSGSRPRWLPKLRRGRFFEPTWPQGPQTTWTPTTIGSRRSITTRLVRRSRQLEPGWAQSTQIIRDLVILLGRVVPKWEVGVLQGTSISSQSLEYVRIGSVSAQFGGIAVNPTADVVKMAFMSSTAAPSVSDWKTASWNTVGAGQYQIQCLIGPGGVIQLTPGYWYVWVQITDNPETIVRSADILQVTA